MEAVNTPTHLSTEHAQQDGAGVKTGDPERAHPPQSGRRAAAIAVLAAAVVIAAMVGIIYLLLQNPPLTANIRDIVIIVAALVLIVMSSRKQPAAHHSALSSSGFDAVLAVRAGAYSHGHSESRPHRLRHNCVPQQEHRPTNDQGSGLRRPLPADDPGDWPKA
jgi:hypothetical protein